VRDSFCTLTHQPELHCQDRMLWHTQRTSALCEYEIIKSSSRCHLACCKVESVRVNESPGDRLIIVSIRGNAIKARQYLDESLVSNYQGGRSLPLSRQALGRAEKRNRHEPLLGSLPPENCPRSSTPSSPSLILELRHPTYTRTP
jgi:hypothetical protein